MLSYSCCNDLYQAQMFTTYSSLAKIGENVLFHVPETFVRFPIAIYAYSIFTTSAAGWIIVELVLA